MRKQLQAARAVAMAGLVVMCTAGAARAQFQVPPNSLSLDDTGTLEAMQGNLIKFRDSNMEVWLLTVNPQTLVEIEGEADRDYLRPGLAVEFAGTIDENNTVAEPIEELTVINGKGRPAVGLFDPTDVDEDARPVRNPVAGEYRIRGRVVSVKGGELLVAAGRFRISAKAADDLKVKLTIDDPRLAQSGDTMQVKAWYTDVSKPVSAFNKPGQALAEEVRITLSKDAVAGKRGR